MDLFCEVPEGFVEKLGIAKGSMELVGPELSESVTASLGQIDLRGGGSAANTLVGLSSLGNRVALIARTDMDSLGNEYVADLQRSGVFVFRPDLGNDLGTGRCLVMVTPDGERTMATWLGAASHLRLDGESKAVIGRARILYIEGYLYDLDATKKQIHRAVEIAIESDVKIALSLSDPFCVARHKQEFMKLLDGPVSLVFANEKEAEILTGKTDVDDMVGFLKDLSLSGAVTLGSSGAKCFDDSGTYFVPAIPVARVVDTTGAGDMFAAGFIHGVLRGEDVATSGRFGVVCAAEIVSHFGARPKTDLMALLQASMG